MCERRKYVSCLSSCSTFILICFSKFILLMFCSTNMTHTLYFQFYIYLYLKSCTSYFTTHSIIQTFFFCFVLVDLDWILSSIGPLTPIKVSVKVLLCLLVFILSSYLLNLLLPYPVPNYKGQNKITSPDIYLLKSSLLFFFF